MVVEPPTKSTKFSKGGGLDRTCFYRRIAKKEGGDFFQGRAANV